MLSDVRPERLSLCGLHARSHRAFPELSVVVQDHSEDLPVSAHARHPPSTDLDKDEAVQGQHRGSQKHHGLLSADLQADATARHSSPPQDTASSVARLTSLPKLKTPRASLLAMSAVQAPTQLPSAAPGATGAAPRHRLAAAGQPDAARESGESAEAPSQDSHHSQVCYKGNTSTTSSSRCTRPPPDCWLH